MVVMALLAPQQRAQTAVLFPPAIPKSPTWVPHIPDTARSKSKEVFLCDEESHFYAQSLVTLGLKRCRDDEQIIEFGTGDGLPVIHAMETWHKFGGVVHGFEINPSAASVAQHNAAAHGMSKQYKVRNECFFRGLQQVQPTMLVANPPYIPAPDDNIMMPQLHGGTDGANLTRSLMSLGLGKVVLLISSYSNPVETLRHANKEGYILRDFLLTNMPFGTYSSELKVRSWLAKMKREGKAFFTSRTYLLAGVLLEKPASGSEKSGDLTEELLSIMTSLH